MPTHVTPSELADALTFATPNLLGSIYCRKQLDIPKKNHEVLNADFGGAIIKEWDIHSVASLKDYPNAVNNARERNGLERTFVPQPRRWGHYREGSAIVLDHTDKKTGIEYSYIDLRLNKNSRVETRYYDGNGNLRTYEEVEPVLGSQDKRRTKEKSRQASADAQGLPLAESVKPMDTRTDHILRLSYQGEQYVVIPETEGGTSSQTDTVTTPTTTPVTA